MNPTRAVWRGIGRVSRAWRLVVVYYAATLAFALAVVVPTGALLARALGYSTWTRQLAVEFDLSWIYEFLYETRGWPLVAATPLAVMLGAGYVLLTTWLAGGAIATLTVAHGGFQSPEFWGGCARNFWRLLRLLTWSAICYAAILAASVGMAWAGDVLWRNSMEERPVVLFGWARSALTLGLVLLAGLIFDYAKIRLVVDDARGSLRAALGSARFVFRNFRLTATTYAITCALAVLVVLASLRVLRGGLLWLLLFAVVQQAFVAVRIWVRLVSLSAAIEVYLARRPPPPGELAAVAVLTTGPEPSKTASAEADPDSGSAASVEDQAQ
jgi:hypothetical protein